VRAVHLASAALVLVAAAAAPAAPGSGDPPPVRARGGYVGAEACGSCHPQVLESWRRTAHARASAPDRLGPRARDPSCLSCHSTGDAVSGRGRLAGVQCEACHGPGGAYAMDDVMRNAHLARALGLRETRDLDAVCLRCHQESLRPEPFDAREAWRQIAH
jgi:hypothetical protein